MIKQQRTFRTRILEINSKFTQRLSIYSHAQVHEKHSTFSRTRAIFKGIISRIKTAKIHKIHSLMFHNIVTTLNQLWNRLYCKPRESCARLLHPLTVLDLFPTISSKPCSDYYIIPFSLFLSVMLWIEDRQKKIYPISLFTSTTYYGPSSKGTKLPLQVIKAIIIITDSHENCFEHLQPLQPLLARYRDSFA